MDVVGLRYAQSGIDHENILVKFQNYQTLILHLMMILMKETILIRKMMKKKKK